MHEIDLATDPLKDGKWHKPSAIAKKCNLSNEKIKNILIFLEEYSFVQIDLSGQKVRAHPSFQKFLEQTGV